MKAWLFQDHQQKQKLGDRCPWSVGWRDPEGRRKSKRIGSQSDAEKYRRKIEGQLAAGTYSGESRKQWPDFMAEYESRVLTIQGETTREATQYALNHFERLVAPTRVQAITSRVIDDYVAKRSKEPRKRPGKPRRTKKPIPASSAQLISPATINKELRTLRAVLRRAHKWGYLPRVPEFEFLREPGRLPPYVTPEHFVAIYNACDAATHPDDQPYSAADWWRALLVMAYMTGWRIGAILQLRRADVDLEAGEALSRAEHNKGRRDQKVPLHPLVVQHFEQLPSFAPEMLPWGHGRRRIFEEFGLIQTRAGVKPATKNRYGFHDLRRAFATMNAGRMTGDALQSLMQHRDYQTTQRYINMARQLNPAVENLFVPAIAPAARVAN